MGDIDRLLALADAIAKGGAIDRPDERQFGPSADPCATPSSPHDLERLVAALRRIDQETPETDSTLPPSHAPEPTLDHWAHLTIVSTMSTGSLATVYRAHDTRLGVDVALELLRPAPDRESTNRFLQEGRLLSRVHHPNVLRCYGSDESGGYAGRWTELVRAPTLAESLEAQVAFSAEDAATIGWTMCHAAAAVHQAGLPYRHITERDVTRDATGRTILMAPGIGPAIPEAGVVAALAALMARLLTPAGDLYTATSGLANAVASVIARATSAGADQRLTTLDDLEAALARATSSSARPAADALAQAPHRRSPPRRWLAALARTLRPDRK